MVDDAYNTWLIEINSSPACDYSTKVTERYVQKALVELLSVVLDVREWESQPKKQRGEKPNTGGWECIYQGPLLELPAGSFGTDMSLKGEAVKGMNSRRSVTVVPLNQSTLQVENATLQGSKLSSSLENADSLKSSLKKMVTKNIPSKPTQASKPNRNVTIKGSENRKQDKDSDNQSDDEQQINDVLSDDEEADRWRKEGMTSHRSNNSQKSTTRSSYSNQPDLTSQTYDDSDEESLKKKPAKSFAGSSLMSNSSKSASVKKDKPMVSNVTAVSSQPPPGSVAIPIKTFTVDF